MLSNLGAANFVLPKKQPVADDLPAVQVAVHAHDVRVGKDARMFGTLVGQLQRGDQVVANLEVDEDAHGEVHDERDGERGGRAFPDCAQQRRGRVKGLTLERGN